jgi:hypothetical protein
MWCTWNEAVYLEWDQKGKGYGVIGMRQCTWNVGSVVGKMVG